MSAIKKFNTKIPDDVITLVCSHKSVTTPLNKGETRGVAVKDAVSDKGTWYL